MLEHRGLKRGTRPLGCRASLGPLLLAIAGMLLAAAHTAAHTAAHDAPHTGARAVSPGTGDPYQQAWDLYHLKYRPGDALEHIRGFLSRGDLLPEERIRGLVLQATCQVALDQDVAARQTLEKVLVLDQDYRIDARRVPPRLWQLYYELLRSADRLRAPVGIQTLAILDLTNNSVTEREAMGGLGQAVADILVGSLSGHTDMRIVERERIDFIRGEVGLQQSDTFDRDSAVRAGRLLGAQSLLLGGFLRIDDRIRIDVRIVKTETGEILKTRFVEGKFKDLFELLRSLGKDVCDDLDVVHDLPPDSRDADFGAFVEYSQGLVMMKLNRLPEALAHFEQALALDDQFAEARSRVRQLAPLLAGGGQER